jgi:malonate decarboxylase alpha subunit
MAQQTLARASRSWTTRRDEKRRRMQRVRPWMDGPILPKARIIEALETLTVSGDRIVIEGDNQKQADFLSRSLAKVDPEKLHDLHLIISSISRPEHLTLFELGIAKKIDFAFAGPQSLSGDLLAATLFLDALERGENEVKADRDDSEGTYGAD